MTALLIDLLITVEITSGYLDRTKIRTEKWTPVSFLILPPYRIAKLLFSEDDNSPCNWGNVTWLHCVETVFTVKK